MTMRKFATTLRDLIIKEVSVVDRPANPHALFVLKKRAEDQADPTHVQNLLKSIQSILEDAEASKQEKNAALRETLEQYAEVTGRDGLTDISAITKKSKSDPFEDQPGVRGFAPKLQPFDFMAGGSGPTHDKLYKLFDNYRREMGPFAGTAAFAAAWSDLSDVEKDEIRNEEAAVEQARQAKEAGRRAAAAKDGSMMNKSQLMDVAKRVVAGRAETICRGDLVSAAHKIALAERQPRETIEKSRARFWESPAGIVVYRAMKVAKVEDPEDDSRLELGPAMKALHKRADEIRLGKAMTREQAVAKIAMDPGEARFWNAARAEERERDQFVE
jgi:hypothetical protein